MRADIEALTFDVVICFETIEHVARYREALTGIFRALKPGGTLLISTPNRLITSPHIRSLQQAVPSAFHTQEFTPCELQRLLVETGFSAQSLHLYGQRQQPRIPTRVLRFLYKILCDSCHRTSPVFAPLTRFLQPRIFLFVAQKPDAEEEGPSAPQSTLHACNSSARKSSASACSTLSPNGSDSGTTSIERPSASS